MSDESLFTAALALPPSERAGFLEHSCGGDAARRAERFKRVRDAHQTELAEDYVELIADLIERAKSLEASDKAV